MTKEEKDKMKFLVLQLVRLLVKNDYQALQKLAGGERYATRENLDDLKASIDEYGATFVLPPDSEFESTSIYEVEDSSPRRWAIVMSLWTKEEGRSDLSLEAAITEGADHYAIELENIHVM